MTDKEKAIVMAYTGICMLTGDKFQIFHKYVEDIMNRPIMTHELGWLEDEIKEKSKADFMALCANESSSENPNKWIPVSERLPETNIYDGHGPVWKHEVLITGYLSFDDKKETFINMAFAEDVRNKCVPNTNVTAWMPLPKVYGEVEE